MKLVVVAIPFYEGHVSTLKITKIRYGYAYMSQSLFMKGMFQLSENFQQIGFRIKVESQSLFMKGMFQRLSLKSSLILACECLE